MRITDAPCRSVIATSSTLVARLLTQKSLIVAGLKEGSGKSPSSACHPRSKTANARETPVLSIAPASLVALMFCRDGVVVQAPARLAFLESDHDAKHAHGDEKPDEPAGTASASPAA